MIDVMDVLRALSRINTGTVVSLAIEIRGRSSWRRAGVDEASVRKALDQAQREGLVSSRKVPVNRDGPWYAKHLTWELTEDGRLLSGG